MSISTTLSPQNFVQVTDLDSPKIDEQKHPFWASLFCGFCRPTEYPTCATFEQGLDRGYRLPVLELRNVRQILQSADQNSVLLYRCDSKERNLRIAIKRERKIFQVKPEKNDESERDFVESTLRIQLWTMNEEAKRLVEHLTAS